MKTAFKIFAASALALALAILAFGCSGGDTTTTPPVCDHSYVEEVAKEPLPLADGIILSTCSKCGDSFETAIPATKTVKILAIGNSFSVDAMQYLWDICNAGGAEEIILGNLYIGGCSLMTHQTNTLNDAKAYTYYKNVDGTWRETAGTSLLSGLTDEDWDIITVQQASGDSGMPNTYKPLTKLLGYIEENKTNPDARIWWHMTWAYQSDSTHSPFQKYEKDQMTMYNAILGALEEKVLVEPSIYSVIPSGTAIQNLRTSYIGDTVTRDGYHMSYDVGRYTTALTWFATLTGGDVDAIDWVPEDYIYVSIDLAAIRAAVKDAIVEKYAVTASEHTEKPEETIFDALGIDLSKYEEIDWSPKVGAYYNASHHANLFTTANNSPNFIASKIFDRESLPVGSIVVLDSGYQYRPEAWISLSEKISSRPSITTSAVVLITEKWWGSYNYRAFNLAHVGGNTAMKSEDSVHLKIYVPIAE